MVCSSNLKRSMDGQDFRCPECGVDLAVSAGGGRNVRALPGLWIRQPDDLERVTSQPADAASSAIKLP